MVLSPVSSGLSVSSNNSNNDAETTTYNTFEKCQQQILKTYESNKCRKKTEFVQKRRIEALEKFEHGYRDDKSHRDVDPGSFNGKIENRYYSKEEWFSMSRDQKRKVYELCEKAEEVYKETT